MVSSCLGGGDRGGDRPRSSAPWLRGGGRSASLLGRCGARFSSVGVLLFGRLLGLHLDELVAFRSNFPDGHSAAVFDELGLDTELESELELGLWAGREREEEEEGKKRKTRQRTTESISSGLM